VQSAQHKGTSLLKPSVTAAAATATTGCPQAGQRISFDDEPGGIYLVVGTILDLPDIYWIPSVDVYNSLWDSYSGITTVSGSLRYSCFTFHNELAGGWLVKSPNSPNVYIYDDSDGGNGGYRWITSAAVFNEYGFFWSKIVTQDPFPLDGDKPILDYDPWSY